MIDDKAWGTRVKVRIEGEIDYQVANGADDRSDEYILNKVRDAINSILFDKLDAKVIKRDTNVELVMDAGTQEMFRRLKKLNPNTTFGEKMKEVPAKDEKHGT